MTIKIAVVIYKGVELVDMCGPMDVFLHVNGVIPNRYQIYTVAESTAAVSSEGSILKIIPDYDFKSCPAPDIIIVPGLMDAALNPTVADDAVITWLERMMLSDKQILSVCVGLLNLAAARRLSGRTVTTHYLAINSFHKQNPDVRIVKNVRYVDDGTIVSTGGITSGIDGALHLVEKYDGAAVAQQIADLMVYNRQAPLPPYTVLPPYYV